MKILEIRSLQGPNVWSISRKNLIVLKIDLEQLEFQPSNTLPGFNDRLKQLLPSLFTHRCSEGVEGGFFQRLDTGTWMGHVIEHVALELQTLAGMECGFGRTRSTGETGIYHVVFSYIVEQAGRHAATSATNLVQALINETEVDLQKDIEDLRELYNTYKYGPSTGAIVDEAEKAGIPTIRLNEDSYVQLGYGSSQKRIEATTTSQTSTIAVEIAGDKTVTKEILRSAGIPVPEGDMVSTPETLLQAINKIGFPLVTKPFDGNHGNGATTDINSEAEALRGFELAKSFSKKVIIEKFIQGFDFRLLVVNFKLIAASKRIPASVYGDGYSTIEQLVKTANEDPRRGIGHNNVLTNIELDDISIQYLSKYGYTINSIPVSGQLVSLKPTANISTGGIAEDVTDLVSKENIALAERIARTIGLDVCGIDVVATDITKPIAKYGAIIEVNAGPGFRMHTNPSIGKPRPVAKAVVDMLFPDPSKSRIPIIAVTGTNGKTTTTRLIAHIVAKNGNKVGFTTTDGIYIHNQMIEEGDCTGPKSASMILKDPSVDFAVLECARGGLLRSGLAFDACDVGVVTNVAADHLGLKDINTIEDMARVKSVIPESVKKSGFAVLNADNVYTKAMAANLDCNVAYFSLDPNNPLVVKHCLDGNIAAVLEHGYISIMNGTELIRICEAAEVPITFGGKALFMVENILAAALAAYVSDIKIPVISEAMISFIPSPESTPGRLNFFDFKKFRILVDYAHNPHGLTALGEFIKQAHPGHTVGILTGVGDRRDEDIEEFAKIACNLFEEIIIRVDDDTRGRDKSEIIGIIKDTILKLEPGKVVRVIEEELEALNYAIKNAKENSLIVHLSEDIKNSVEIIRGFIELEEDFKSQPQLVKI